MKIKQLTKYKSKLPILLNKQGEKRKNANTKK